MDSVPDISLKNFAYTDHAVTACQTINITVSNAATTIPFQQLCAFFSASQQNQGASFANDRGAPIKMSDCYT